MLLIKWKWRYTRSHHLALVICIPFSGSFLWICVLCEHLHFFSNNAHTKILIYHHKPFWWCCFISISHSFSLSLFFYYRFLLWKCMKFNSRNPMHSSSCERYVAFSSMNKIILNEYTPLLYWCNPHAITCILNDNVGTQHFKNERACARARSNQPVRAHVCLHLICN